jgi:hypothetical protein
VESLLLVVAELVSVPRLVALTLLVALAAAVALILGHLTIGRRLHSWPLRWWRRLVWSTIGGLGFMLAGLVFIDLLLFAPALRIALDQIELRSGLDVGFRSADGSLLTGRLELHDVTLRRSSTGLDLSLTVQHLSIDVDMLRLYRAELPIDLVRAVGVRGTIVRRDGDTPGPARPFIIDRLELEDVQVDFEDAITAPFRSLPIVFTSLKLSPLRSEFALLDALCGSEASGSARGYAFGAGGHAWQARGIPIGPAAHKLGAAGRWIRGGDIDLTLRCDPGRDTEAVPLAITLHLHDLKIAPPGDSGRHPMASQIAGALARLGSEATMDFAFELPRERFRGASNVGQLGLWEGAILGWNLALAARLGLTQEQLRVFGLGSRVLDKLAPEPARRN